MISVRLSCTAFYVDVRFVEINGRFIASADTPDGPSLGVGTGAIEAMPFGGAVQDLLASLPQGVSG